MTKHYPAVYFCSDTTSEKAYEEFYVPVEKIDIQRGKTLGVVEQTTRHDMSDLSRSFEKHERDFTNEDFTNS